MTIGELLGFMNMNPIYPGIFFILLPIAAFLGNVMSGKDGHQSPWCIYYAALVYLAVIPGIFAVLLNLYHILFEKRSIYDVNIMVQLLPIVSMIFTLMIIKRNVSFSDIPGFGKMTGFVSIISMLMLAFFILEKAHLLVFSYLPIHWILIMLIVMFGVVHLGLKRMLR